MCFVAKPGPNAENGMFETTRSIGFGAADAGHSVPRNRPRPRELIPQNRGELWQCMRGVLYDVKSVSVDQRSSPETVDRENGLYKSPEFHLVAAAKNGHAAAFDALCHPHTKRLFRRTYRIARNREDAED